MIHVFYVTTDEALLVEVSGKRIGAIQNKRVIIER